MTELNGKTVLITGATGFIGRHVTEHLLKAGAKVYAIVRKDSRNLGLLPKGDNLTVLFGSLGDADDVLSAEGFYEENGPKADIFLHLAWGGVNREEIDSPAVQSENVADSLQCLRAAAKAGCSLFMDAGSRVEYGITEDGTMREERECHPVNEYGKAKLRFYEAARELAKDAGLTYYHLRFFSVYGADDHPWSIISTLTRELPKGGTVSLSACRHRWNFMDVDDAARAVLSLMSHSDSFPGETRTVNVASADTRILRDFVEEIDELTAHRGTLEFGTFQQAKEGALSICPVLNNLQELTENTFREEETFRSGIMKILSST